MLRVQVFLANDAAVAANVTDISGGTHFWLMLQVLLADVEQPPAGAG